MSLETVPQESSEFKQVQPQFAHGLLESTRVIAKAQHLTIRNNDQEAL